MNDELYHYGVLGMRWGVRRYQNYDGTYTQRGLKRYREAESNYESAKKLHKTLKDSRKGQMSVRDPKTGEYVTFKASKNAIKESRSNVKQAKTNLKNQYNKLKYEKLADEGKQLYREGKRIRPNNRASSIRQGVVSLAAVGAYYAYANSGKRYYSKLIDASIPLEALAPAAIFAGGSFVNALFNIKPNRENKRLSAYYAH